MTFIGGIFGVEKESEKYQIGVRSLSEKQMVD